MSWKLSHLSSSLMGLLRDTDASQQSANKLDDIREEMLECLAPYMESKSVRAPVWAKVLYAEDIQTLWYQRSDLMHILSAHCGETAAAQTLERITALFRNQVPAAQFASAQRRR